MKVDLKKYSQNAERRMFTNIVELEKRAKRAEGGEDGDGQDKEVIQTITGYAALFNSPTQIGSGSWGFTEQISPKAFDNCDMSRCMCLFNHEESYVLGKNGINLRLSVDAKGLKYECDLPDTHQAEDLGELIAQRIIDKSSFAFVAAKSTWVFDEEDPSKDQRTIDEISDLFDVSPVTFPAYEDTEVASRSRENAKPHRSNAADLLGLEISKLKIHNHE